MNKIFLLISTVLLSSTIGAFALDSKLTEEDSSSLLGKWECVKRVLRDGSDGSELTFDQQPYKCDLSIEFYEDSKGIILTDGTNFEYKMSEDTLYLGSQKYSIVEFTNEKLVILKLSLVENNPLDMKLTLVRVNRP